MAGAAMRASEALKQWECDKPTCPMCRTRSCEWCQRWDVMIEALREKAEREERERPKVPLAQQAAAVELANADLVNDWSSSNLQALAEAAATLRKLDEEGGQMLAASEVWTLDTCAQFARLLRSLGVEAKKS